MSFDDVTTNSQSESRATCTPVSRLLKAIQGIKQLCAFFLGRTGSGVIYLDNNHAVVPGQTHVDSSRDIRVGDRVVKQVLKQLIDAFAIAINADACGAVKRYVETLGFGSIASR